MQPDVTAYIPTLVGKQSRFQPNKAQSGRRLHHRFERRTGVGIQAARDVNRKGGLCCLIDAFDPLRIRWLRVALKSDAEEGVYTNIPAIWRLMVHCDAFSDQTGPSPGRIGRSAFWAFDSTYIDGFAPAMEMDGSFSAISTVIAVATCDPKKLRVWGLSEHPARNR